MSQQYIVVLLTPSVNMCVSVEYEYSIAGSSYIVLLYFSPSALADLDSLSFVDSMWWPICNKYGGLKWMEL
jgi:hypothetical protein